MKINANKLDEFYLKNDEFNEKKAKMQNIFDKLVKNYNVSKCDKYDKFICKCRLTRIKPPYIEIGIERVYYTPICPHCKTAMFKPEKLLNQLSKKGRNEFLTIICERCKDIKDLQSMAYGLIYGDDEPIKEYINENPKKAIEINTIYELRKSKMFYDWED